MSVHAFHDELPGYHPDQLLVDGCPECEARAKDVDLAIAHLDGKWWAQAWLRAADQIASTPPSGERGGPRSDAETPLLRALWGVQVQLERLGIPLGYMPVGLGVGEKFPVVGIAQPAARVLPERTPIR
jgi:hypothetical protein